MRVCVVAAHPDDETVGASALLGSAHDVTVVHVTSGAPNDSRWWPAGIADRRRYAQVRASEAEHALAIVGVPRIALDFTDQDTMRVLPELVAAVDSVCAELEPDLVVTHAYEGGHPDHDSVAFAAAMVARTRPHVCVLEMALYHGADRTLRAGELLGTPAGTRYVLDSVQRERRLRMLDAYISQRATLAPFVPLGHECLRVAPAYDFARPPHDGLLQYERWGMASGLEWRAYAKRCAQRYAATCSASTLS